MIEKTCLKRIRYKKVTPYIKIIMYWDNPFWYIFESRQFFLCDINVPNNLDELPDADIVWDEEFCVVKQW